MSTSSPDGPAPRWELPLLGQPPRERADAARNRQRILDAALRLACERGIAEVSMDDVAAAAGVGKGTVYRRFRDRYGLALALLDEVDRKLQEAVLRGPPPLGPGAPPDERLRAFLEALADVVEVHADLLSSAGVGSRYRSGPYGFHRLHVFVLLREARPDLDAGYLSDALLAPLEPSLYRYQRRERGLSSGRVKAGLRALVDGVLACPGSAPAQGEAGR